MNKIIVNRGSFKLEEFDFIQNSLTIGRAADNDIKLDDASVSNHHAKIVKILNTCYIQDLNSTNGTLVNGKKTHKRSLYSGDIISLGKHQLLYQSDNPATASAENDSTMLLQQDDIERSLKEYMHSQTFTNPQESKPGATAAKSGKPEAAAAAAAAKISPTGAMAGSQAHQAQGPTHAQNPAQAQNGPVAKPVIPQHYVEHLKAAAQTVAKHDTPAVASAAPPKATVQKTTEPDVAVASMDTGKKTVPDTRLILGRRPKGNSKPVIQVDTDRPKPAPYDIPIHNTAAIPAGEPKAVITERPLSQTKPDIASAVIDTDSAAAAVNIGSQDFSDFGGAVAARNLNEPKPDPAFHGARNIVFTEPKPRKGVLSALWAVIIVALLVEVVYIVYRALN
ncbi:MAG: FHA domain-containing protein [Gammaproteobacteria bacterium]|nr:FHA domain-containing protein [Gammaproteobacteria bacterium]